jgi:hypothetical protein
MQVSKTSCGINVSIFGNAFLEFKHQTHKKLHNTSILNPHLELLATPSEKVMCVKITKSNI